MKLNQVKVWLSKFVSNLGRVTLFLVAIIAGFLAGNLYSHYEASFTSAEMRKPKTGTVTSVAINERNELMIINRESGLYEIYSSEVGQMLFDLYASKIHYKSKTSK